VASSYVLVFAAEMSTRTPVTSETVRATLTVEFAAVRYGIIIGPVSTHRGSPAVVAVCVHGNE
jgi:hypothetical protein